jgi:hypothetical protein
MYKKIQNRQFGLKDFNQPIGLEMNPDNRWVAKASLIPWDEIEDKYASLFASHTGNVAKSLRMALGSLIIQKEYDYSDRELVNQITENPYYQYFIGLSGYQMNPPYDPSVLVDFRKRLTAEVIGDINEIILKSKSDKSPPPSGGGSDTNDAAAGVKNSGTIILDATCAPQNIRYPQDVSLLNEVREKMEDMIDLLCYEHNYYRPRTYRQNARRDYLKLAKTKKRTSKMIRRAIKKQLQYIRRDRGYVEGMLDAGCVLDEKRANMLSVLDKVYEQQKHMYDNNIHAAPDRIVSISQPYIRPIVRGKAKSAVEFGAKFDLSIVNGYGRIEKLSFDAYNESQILKDVIERYKEREGYYPERILVDKIYRNRDNLKYCKERGIRISGPSLGRPGKETSANKKQGYVDGIDRIEVERAFSLAKRNYGLGLIRTKREDTTRGAIALSVLAMNINRMVKDNFFSKAIMELSRYVYYIYRKIVNDFAIQRTSGISAA